MLQVPPNFRKKLVTNDKARTYNCKAIFFFSFPGGLGYNQTRTTYQNSGAKLNVNNPYKLICSKCHREFVAYDQASDEPKRCPHCNAIITDQTNMVYRPSRDTKAYRTIARIILIFFGILVILGIIAVILSL